METLRTDDPSYVGPIRLVGRLGAGGMGRVYLGVDAAGAPVAVKVVHAAFAGDPQFRRRFRLEVEAVRQVAGGPVIAVVDADPDAALPWLATEYVPGPSLAEAVENTGPLPPSSVPVLARGLAAALALIHAKDLVHRDVKPSNVLLGADGPRLIDFGRRPTARTARCPAWSPTAASTAPTTTRPPRGTPPPVRSAGSGRNGRTPCPRSRTRSS